MSDYPQDTHPFTPLDAPLTPDEQEQDFEQAPRGRGCGCWVTLISTLVVFIVLIAIGLYLPPINLLQRLTTPNFTTLTARANALTNSGLTLAAYNLQGADTLSVTLNSVPMDRFLAGDTKFGTWVPDALAAVPPSLALQSPVYALATSGNSTQVALSVDLPADANPDIYDLYGWNQATGKWTFMPAHATGGTLVATLDTVPDRVALFQAAPTDQPRVLVSYDVTQVLSGDAAKLATIIAPAGLQPTLDGKLAGNLAAGFDTNAGYLVTPALRNYSDPRATDPDTIATILSNSDLRREHAAQIAAFASSGYDGVLIDYRDLSAEQRDNFTAFVSDLGRQLDQLGLLLIVSVPMAQNQSGQWDTGAYDWRALGASADYLQIQLSPDPMIFVPGADRPLEAMTRWAVGEVSRDKLLLGLSTLSQRQVGDGFTALSYDQALSALGNVTVDAPRTEAGTVDPGSSVTAKLDGYQAVAGSEPNTMQPYLDYMDTNGNAIARMWLTTPDALRYRMDRTVPFALGGVAFDDLMGSGVAKGVTDAIMNYKVSVPAPPQPSQLALNWTIQGVNGVIGQATTQLGQALVTTIQAPDGNYAINVEVISGDNSSSSRGGAAVAVFAPTPTPTPLPTSTPTPTPRPTTVPVRQVANAAAPSGGGQPAVAPASGSIVGGFEYGGHVDNPATGAAGQMKHAGMTWMKIQLRYTPGTGPDVAAGPIATAHGAGFKILLGLVGYPNDLAGGGDGYIQGFANWVGGVAALGPDAIEVWNEPNLDREWPRGQISGGNYVKVLSASYQAVKSRNGGVMVISAAPAPTGAEAAYPGQVENDDHWLEDVVNAGGLNYADCVGAHYNEGIVAPTQNNGDPRDGYYTRFLPGMINTYWGIIGGQRKICFTELGYLSPEGFGSLPSGFGWAANTTVAQQAAWLAGAAAVSSQSGKVRLMIVWNVDFTAYGTDPMGGYAMIRPGGSCPACDAMAAAR
ncbi:MAG: hypothetical protein GC204_14340 [Chloroflexi bacterium]|nr:hypothetical protein [Chloroflexota bacterium]